MDSNDLRARIADQFSYRSERADIWRGFDLVLNTDSFLNLGYSRWYQPQFVGSSQRRLATVVGERLASTLGATDRRRLLDVGCGRGGPAIHLDAHFGFDVTGVDLVPYNVTRATQNATAAGSSARFLVGDATALPIAAASMDACTTIDSLVYVPDRGEVVAELADVLAPDGVLVVTDLLRGSGIDADASAAVARFADAWDMPPLVTTDEFEETLTDAGFDLRAVETITAHSVGRFRRWTTLFLATLSSPLGPSLVWALRRLGLDPGAIFRQVRTAHEALPFLEHVLYVATR